MLLLAAWLGLAIYFSAVVAPSAFAVLRSFDLANPNEVAGSIVTKTLSAVNKSGMLFALLALATGFLIKRHYQRVWFILQNLLLIIIASSTAIGEWVIARRMRGLRAAMNGHIDLVPPDDPNRMAFSALHGYSVAALSVAIIAALAVILLMIFSQSRIVETAKE
jgi:hypothetical protein